MSAINFDTVAFDLDGTLADTAPGLTAALNHLLGRFDRSPLPAERVRKLVGQGARALIRKGLAATGESTEALIDLGLPLFLEYYEAHICDGTKAYRGVERALDALSAMGVGLAICTNKPEFLTQKLVDALGWNGRFQGIVGADTLPVRKPDPAPLHEAIARGGGGRAAFVGDSITDADTARAAMVPMVAVSFGFSDRPVERLGAAFVIDHYDQLLPALESLSSSAVSVPWQPVGDAI